MTIKEPLQTLSSSALSKMIPHLQRSLYLGKIARLIKTAEVENALLQKKFALVKLKAVSVMQAKEAIKIAK